MILYAFSMKRFYKVNLYPNQFNVYFKNQIVSKYFKNTHQNTIAALCLHTKNTFIKGALPSKT